MEITISHPWEPIEDLPKDWRTSRPDLDNSLELWERERKSLKDPSKLERLHERLATLWSIETGVLEKLYTMDRGTTMTLVNLGLQALEQFSTSGRISKDAAALIQDQRRPWDSSSPI